MRTSDRFCANAVGRTGRRRADRERKADIRPLIIGISALILMSGHFGQAGLPQGPQGRAERLAAALETASAQPFASRRARLMVSCEDAVVIIPSQYMAPQGLRNNLDFFYLTGLQEPEAVLVLDPSGDPRETLFLRGAPATPRASGSSIAGRAATGGNGDDSARTSLAQERKPGTVSLAVKPPDQILAHFLPMVRARRVNRAFLPFSDLGLLTRLFGSAGATGPFFHFEGLFNVDPIVHEMRLTKDALEIQALREAVGLTAEALNEAFRAAEPGVREVDLAAILKFVFNRKEADESFLQTASGPNSTNVHFGATARRLEAGDLVVFDVGAYVRGYTSDISRTIPADGRFSKDQRAIYELVLEAQKEGCRRLVPGVTFKTVQDEVERVLMRGLADLGLVTDVDCPWQRGIYIQHGFGHGIGLDVHDCWAWHYLHLDRIIMAPGMVMTMEPGLYFPDKGLESSLAELEGEVPDAELVAFAAKVAPIYARYARMGVRIEDDVLITESGNEILSEGVPKEVAAIERMMKEKGPSYLRK